MVYNFPLNHTKTVKIDVEERYEIDRDNSAMYYYHILPFIRLNKFDSYTLEIVISSSFQHKSLGVPFKYNTSKEFVLNDISETDEFKQQIEDALFLSKKEHIALLKTSLNNEVYQERIFATSLETFKSEWLYDSLIYKDYLIKRKLQFDLN